jgi:hypothetical protein
MKPGIHCVRTYWIRCFTAFCRRDGHGPRRRSLAGNNLPLSGSWEFVSNQTPTAARGNPTGGAET